MALEERLKQRLLGGAVLVALVVIFVPMLIDEPVDSKLVSDHRIPIKPKEIEQPMPTILPPAPTAKAPVTTAEKPPNRAPAEKERSPSSTASEKEKAPVSKVKTAKSEKKTPTAWMIQVASLTVQKNAQKLVDDLKKAGMPAQLESVNVEGKRHYRVRVGPEVNHQLAMKMSERIKREFKLTPKVMRYPE